MSEAEDYALIEEAEKCGRLSDRQLEILDDIATQGFPMTPKQRGFIRAMIDGERYEPEETPIPASAFPRGRPVELPEVLKRLPLKPPARIR